MAKSDDILEKYGITQVRESEGSNSSPANNTQKWTGSGITKADGILSKYGISQVRSSAVDQTYIESFISDWNSNSSRLKTAYDGLNWRTATAWGQDTPYEDTLTDLQIRSGVIRSYMQMNKDLFEEDSYNSFLTQLDDIDRANNAYKMAFSNAKDYYSQWGTEDDYNKWIQYSTPEGRQEQYEKNKARLEELKQQKKKNASATYQPGMNPYTSGGGTVSASPYGAAQQAQQSSSATTDIDREIAQIEKEMRLYEIGEADEDGFYYGSKVVDDYGKYLQDSEFVAASENREFQNADRAALDAYDASQSEGSVALNSGGYFDEEGNIRNSRGIIVQYASAPEVQDKLGLFLSASDDDIAEAYNILSASNGNYETTWADIMQEGDTKRWKYMEPDELQIYYGLLNSEGQDAAYRYLEAMEVELGRREAAETYEAIEAASGWEQVGLNVLSVPMSVFGGIAATADNVSRIVQGKDINPYSRAQSILGTRDYIRYNTAQEIDQATGNAAIPGLGFTFGDAYQAGMSMVDSLVGAKLGGKAYRTFMSMGAASSEATRLYSQGASMDQIALGSVAAGTAEWIFEKYSIENLISLKSPETLRQFLKNSLIQGGIELTEEAATELANIISNGLIMQSESDWAKLLEENGGDYGKTLVEMAVQVANAGLGGFLSGMGSGVLQQGQQYAVQHHKNTQIGRTIMEADGGVDALMNLANEIAGVSSADVPKRLTKQTGKVAKKATAARVGRLYNMVETANASQNQADIAKSLERKGFNSETANDIAEALVASYNGQKLTEAQSKLLKSADNNAAVQDVISNVINIAESTVGQRSQNIRDFQKGVISKASRTNPAQAGQENAPTADKVDAENENGAESHYEVSTDGKTIDSNGNVVTIKGISSIENGRMVLETEDGNTVDAGDVAYGSEGEALVYEAVANLEGMIDTETANRLSKHLLKLGNASSDVYVNGIVQAYTYGYYGYGRAALTGKDTLSATLTEKQRNVAYGLGEQYRGAKIAADQAKAQKATVTQKKATTEKSSAAGKAHFDGDSAASTKKVRRTGRVKGYGVKTADLNKAFNSTQKQAYTILCKIAEVTGIDIVLFQSKPDANGELRGGIVEGIDMNDSHGAFSWHNNKIYIDINAGVLKASEMGDVARYSMLRTFSHEFTHFIEKHNPEQYETFRELVFDVMRRNGENPDALVDEYMDNHKGTSRDDVSREVVAEAMTDILPQTSFVQELAQKHKNIYQKLLDKMKEFVADIKAYFKSIGTSMSKETAAVKEHIDGMVRYADELVEMFDRIAVQAVENYQAAETAQKNTASKSGGVQMQTRSVNGDQVVWIEDNILKENKGQPIHQFIADYIAEHIGEVYTIIESGQKVYIGEDLPGEYTQSKYTQAVLRNNPNIVKAKNRASANLGEMIEIATNRRWEKTKHTHSKDAKYGIYRYDTRFGFPRKDSKGTVVGANIYKADLLIRNASDGKKYLYDIVNIKKDTASSGWLTQRVTSAAGKSAGQKSNVSNNSIRNGSQNVNSNSSGEQHQDRTGTLTNWDVLEKASSIVNGQKLTAAQRDAIRIFNKHLDKVKELSAQKAEQHEILKAQNAGNAPKTEIRATQNRIENLNGQINRETKTMLGLENTPVLKRILSNARTVIEEEQAAERKQALEKYQQRRKEADSKAELRRKIRKAIMDLNKLFKRGKDQRNVKQEMRDVVSYALASAEVLFTTTYTDNDMIRNGVGVVMTEETSKLFNAAKDILAQLDNPPASVRVEELAAWHVQEQHLREKLSRIKAKLKDVFISERARMDGTLVSSLMDGLCNAYAELKNSDKAYIKAAYDDGVMQHLEAIKNGFGVTRAIDMRLDQLEALHNAYSMVLGAIRNANKAFTQGKAVDQIAKQMVHEFGKRKEPKGKLGAVARNISNMTGWDYEKLYYALERIGSDTLSELFTKLANSENIVMADVIEAAQERDRIVEKYGYNNWKVDQKIDKEFVDNTGKTFRLTLGELMSLYAYSRREGAWNHIEFGGFVFGKTSLTEVNAAEAFKLSKERCDAITNMLTVNQKKFVEEMQTFLSDVIGGKGNEVSMLLYGIEMFGEKNYFPIHIAGQYMANAQESQAKTAAGFSSMTNAGFTQTQNKQATAPFIMESFMDVWADHVNEMSRYHGTVPALEDIRRVMNYSCYSESNQNSMSVKAVMENKFGKQAVQYFTNLYREANSGAIRDKMQGTSYKLLSKFRKNSVAYSLSVLIQQPGSISRAYALIDKKYFGLKGIGALPAGITKTMFNRWTKAQDNVFAEMMKYAPGVVMSKEIGGFDTASGNSIRSYLVDTGKKFAQKMTTDTVGGKARAVMGLLDDNPVANLPNVADKIAWIEIWNACKRETAATHKDLAPKSEKFMQAVGERFTEVIRATQVYDSVFSKSPMLKSKNLAIQYLVSFMNEPNTVANMVESGVRSLLKGEVKQATRMVTSVVRSVVFTCVLKSIIYAMRDDDEDETYIEKYIEALVGNLLNDITVFNYIPIARDVWSMAQGYDVERPDMAILADAISSLANVASNIGENTSDMTEEELIEWDKKVTEANWKLVDSVAAFFGIPVKNIRREIDAVLDHARIAHQNAGKTTWLSVEYAVNQAIADASPVFAKPTTASKGDKLYDAIVSGDTAYLSRLKGGYKDESAYNSAVRKALRENDPRIQEAAEARFLGDFSKYKDIFLAIKAEGNFFYEDIRAAVDAAVNELEKKAKGENTKEIAESDETETLFDIENYYTAVVSNDKASASLAYDDLIAGKVAEGYLKHEAEDAIATGFATLVGKDYMDGKISRSRAVQLLKDNTDKGETEVKKWDFELEHGFSWSERVRKYRLGKLSRAELISAVMEIEGETRKSAEAYIDFLDLEMAHEDTDITANHASSYFQHAEPAGISIDVYLDYRQRASLCKSDFDENGKAISGSKKAKVMAVIDSLPITSAQKDALYFASGYKESALYEAPWH